MFRGLRRDALHSITEFFYFCYLLAVFINSSLKPKRLTYNSEVVAIVKRSLEQQPISAPYLFKSHH